MKKTVSVLRLVAVFCVVIVMVCTFYFENSIAELVTIVCLAILAGSLVATTAYVNGHSKGLSSIVPTPGGFQVMNDSFLSEPTKEDIPLSKEHRYMIGRRLDIPPFQAVHLSDAELLERLTSYIHRSNSN